MRKEIGMLREILASRDTIAKQAVRVVIYIAHRGLENPLRKNRVKNPVKRLGKKS